MTPLDLDGLFWLPGKPEEQIAGRLTFDTQNGAELNLIGAFDEIDVEVGEGHPPCRILGIAGKHLVTLDQCQDFGGSVSAPGIHRQRFVPEIIYTGALFDGDGPLSFTAITIAVRHLEQWIGQSSVRVDMRIDDASNEITDTTLTITPIRSTTVSTALGELKLDFGWRLGGDHVVESTVRQNCTLRLQLASPAS